MRPSRERESRQKCFDKYVLSGGKERINKITKQKELFLACFVAPVMFSSSASCQGEFFHRRAYVNKAEIAGSEREKMPKAAEISKLSRIYIKYYQVDHRALLTFRIFSFAMLSKHRSGYFCCLVICLLASIILCQ